MAKVAKLVLVSLMTRVVVDDSATDEQIVEAAQSGFTEIVQTELMCHLDEIRDDTECKYGSIPKDKE